MPNERIASDAFQAEPELGPLGIRSHQLKRSAMRLRQFTGQTQAETRARNPAIDASAIKPLENMRHPVGRNRLAVILHRDLHLAISGRGVDTNRSARLVVLDRILDQVL